MHWDSHWLPVSRSVHWSTGFLPALLSPACAPQNGPETLFPPRLSLRLSLRLLPSDVMGDGAWSNLKKEIDTWPTYGRRLILTKEMVQTTSPY